MTLRAGGVASAVARVAIPLAASAAIAIGGCRSLPRAAGGAIVVETKRGT